MTMTDSFGMKAVHLAQDLIKRLLAFVRAAADAGAAHAADGVDFVDEQQARRVFLGGAKHVAHAAGADADEHLDEFRAADGEERHARLAGDRAGQQRFASAGGADEQTPLGIWAPSRWNFSGLLRNSTISCSSLLAAVMSATSSKVTRILVLS